MMEGAETMKLAGTDHEIIERNRTGLHERLRYRRSRQRVGVGLAAAVALGGIGIGSWALGQPSDGPAQVRADLAGEGSTTAQAPSQEGSGQPYCEAPVTEAAAVGIEIVVVFNGNQVSSATIRNGSANDLVVTTAGGRSLSAVVLAEGERLSSQPAALKASLVKQAVPAGNSVSLPVEVATATCDGNDVIENGTYDAAIIVDVVLGNQGPLRLRSDVFRLSVG